MRTFLVFICSLALACAAGGAQDENKSKKQGPKKNQVQSTQRADAQGGGPQKTKGPQQATARPAARSYSAGVGNTADYQKKAKGSHQVTTTGGRSRNSEREVMNKRMRAQHATAQGSGQSKTKVKTKASQQMATNGGRPESGRSGYQKTKDSQHMTATGSEAQGTKGKARQSQQIATHQSAYYGVQKTKKSKGSATSAAGFRSSTKTYKAKHFTLQTRTHPTTIAGVTFQQNRRIVGSQYWHGPSYTVFRTYTPVWHDRVWWTNHYNRIVFVYGGWYYWNSGWWYPAWGYAPNAYYSYDGPIYAYNDLPPDQVIANVQAALQEEGYYQGEVDGLLGPLTRDALTDYQRDHGLYETAAVDRPTLESLGMA